MLARIAVPCQSGCFLARHLPSLETRPGRCGLPSSLRRHGNSLHLSTRVGGHRAVRSVNAVAGMALPELAKAVEEKDSDAVRAALGASKEKGELKLWARQPQLARRNVFVRELSMVGLKNPDKLAVPSVRDDMAFLVTVVGAASVLAVAGLFLPGDWGFFVPYLTGGVVLVVLAIGSTAPGLLQAGIGSFSAVFPDYKERTLRHEAAHFLVAYLLGVAVVGYSLDTGREHTNLVDVKLQRDILTTLIEPDRLNILGVVAMAGLAGEALHYEQVTGQTADLMSLQRLLNRSKPKLSPEQQQSFTRWATYTAASLLKEHPAQYAALMEAMRQGATVAECVAAIEGA
eukprot:jgi/Mesvir1/19890/Mv13171-RA.1